MTMTMVTMMMMTTTLAPNSAFDGLELQRDVRVLRVCAFAARRGPYEEARRLYEDLAPLKPAPDPRGDAPA